MPDKPQQKHRTNRVFKSLHKPLTYLGVERTLFYFVCVGAVGAFNLFNSILAGIAVFIGGFAFGHWVDTQPRLMALLNDAEIVDDPEALQSLLLDFVADFAKWENSIDQDYLKAARALTAAAYQSLRGEEGTHPLVVDLFAGGGVIPLEALRVGAEAFATDLNPLAVLLNKVVLEYVPKFGDKLVEALEDWETWIRSRDVDTLGEFYPSSAANETTIAYLWARTVLSSAPGEATPVEVPITSHVELIADLLIWNRAVVPSSSCQPPVLSIPSIRPSK